MVDVHSGRFGVSICMDGYLPCVHQMSLPSIHLCSRINNYACMRCGTSSGTKYGIWPDFVENTDCIVDVPTLVAAWCQRDISNAFEEV